MGGRRVARVPLVLFLATVLLANSVPALSAVSASLGTASGIRGVEMSVDGGKMWLPLDKRSLPVLEATDIRSTSGSAVLDLVDGSRLTVSPFSALRLRQTRTSIDVLLDLGRLGFRLPAGSRVAISTVAAKLRTSPVDVQAGEIAVVEGGAVGVRMVQGSVAVQELVGAKRTVLAGPEPVFVPSRPASADQVFATAASAPALKGGKAVFTPRGESLGYLDNSGRLTIEPGYVRDLTSPFPQRLVQAVIARVPESARSQAVPLFDVNGAWVGYLVGSTFYGQDQAVAAPIARRGGATAAWAAAAGGVAGIAAAGSRVVAAAAVRPRPASPFKPS